MVKIIIQIKEIIQFGTIIKTTLRKIIIYLLALITIIKKNKIGNNKNKNKIVENLSKSKNIKIVKN